MKTGDTKSASGLVPESRYDLSVDRSLLDEASASELRGLADLWRRRNAEWRVDRLVRKVDPALLAQHMAFGRPASKAERAAPPSYRPRAVVEAARARTAGAPVVRITEPPIAGLPTRTVS
jgi:hypothetical protein